MQYSFKSANQEFELKLDHYTFTYTVNGKSRAISYAQVDSLRMDYPKTNYQNKKLFSCTLHLIDGPTIRLKSYSKTDNEIDNQFNHYNQFIRVLHIHLMSKSKANFQYGMSLRKYLLVSFVILGVLAISYPLSQIFVGHEVLIFTAVPLAIASISFGFIMKRPISYQPDIIPYHILPGSA